MSTLIRATNRYATSTRELAPRRPSPVHRKSILTLFGTRPEVIKLAPVMHELEQKWDSFRTINVASGQHSDLLYPLIEMFGVRVDYDLHVMTVDQNPTTLFRRVADEVRKIVRVDTPDLILIQGDTTTALAGAVVGCLQGIPVAHIEAGLRSGNILSPYPEEMIRRLVTSLATYHFTATTRNRDALIEEGISENRIFITGNPVVDAVQMALKITEPSLAPSFLAEIEAEIENRKCIVLTTHRRESFGGILAENLKVLREFVREHRDVLLIFPVHPNPNVHRPAQEILAGNPRVRIIPPLKYGDFLRLLSKSWLIVSDSGGIQEEVPSLGKPLLILRANTERPECIEAGLARLVGGCPSTLASMLEEAYRENSWIHSVHEMPNPFGSGDSAHRIVGLLAGLLARRSA